MIPKKDWAALFPPGPGRAWLRALQASHTCNPSVLCATMTGFPGRGGLPKAPHLIAMAARLSQHAGQIKCPL